jgi:hemolysin D
MTTAKPAAKPAAKPVAKPARKPVKKAAAKNAVHVTRHPLKAATLLYSSPNPIFREPVYFLFFTLIGMLIYSGYATKDTVVEAPLSRKRSGPRPRRSRKPCNARSVAFNIRNGKRPKRRISV